MGEWAPNCREAVSAYLQDAELEGRSAASRRSYRAHLSLLRDRDTPLATTDLRSLLYERTRGLTANSVIVVIAAHRSFVRYCLDRGWLQLDPLRGLKPPRKREVPHRYLTAAEVRALCDAATDLLDRAALVLLLLGLRGSEACAVRRQDIARDDDGPYVRVRTAKGGTPRLLPLTEDGAALLLALPARKGTVLGITAHRLWERVTALGLRAGVRCHPHELRHAFAMALYERTEDQGLLQTLLGHRSPAMSRYYARSALERVALRRAREAAVRLWDAPETP